MFDLAEKRLVWISVTWPGLASEGDKLAEPVEHKAEFQVELVDIDQFQFLFVSPIAEDGTKHLWATDEAFAAWSKGEVNDRYRARELTSDWRGIASNRVKVPYSPDAMNALMGKPNFSKAYFQAYMEAWNAIAETRAGNSEGSPETGSTGEPQPS
jgi:hypothetical protein